MDRERNHPLYPTVMMGDEVKGGIKVQYIPATDGLDDDIPF